MQRMMLLAALLACGCLAAAAQDEKLKHDFYQRWLNEDVVYLISAQERQIFSLLKTAEVRERFIEQFWQRRDPNPETEQNEFRDEYYTRIAHANARFGFGNTAGWRSDRGRIYITYGAPDEVEEQGVEETWHYRNRPIFRADAKFQFVDLNRNGEFRLRQ